MSHLSPGQHAPSETARARGLHLAELFDDDLSRNELHEVEQQLAAAQEHGLATSADSARVAQLESRVRELEDYLRAVQESAPWRVVQWARRMAGRSW